MLEQISALVKQYGQDAVINNPDVPNEENNAVLAEATSTITGGMQNMLAGGGLQDIISMFTGGNNNNNPSTAQRGGIGGLLKNPVVTMMIGHLISKLVGKFNMQPQQASSIANDLVPNVLNGLVNRTASNDPSDESFNLNDLIGSLTGGRSGQGGAGGFNFQDLIGQFTGGGGGNGGFDLQDVISQVTNGAQQNQEQQAKNSGGGLADLVKGFFN